QRHKSVYDQIGALGAVPVARCGLSHPGGAPLHGPLPPGADHPAAPHHAEERMMLQRPHGPSPVPQQPRLPRRALLSDALLGATALMTGCAASAQGRAALGTEAPASRSGLTWGWRLPSTGHSARGIGYDVHVLSLVYSGLTRLDPEGQLAPDLAQSWTYNEAGDAVTFHLRPGLTFSDGTAVDAAAVKAGLERSRDLPVATSAQSLAVIEEITADSATDVTLHLAGVNHQIPLLLAGLIGHLVSPAAIADGAE